MNNPNSVLLEGRLSKEPGFIHNDGQRALCYLDVVSERQYKQGDGYIQTESGFRIETRDRLAETCAEYLHEGRGIRVVGRLKAEEGAFLIVAEHVEFKPVALKQPA